MHNHVSLGEDKLCICGDSVREDGAVEDRAAELALYFWGAGRPMPYILHEALDQNKDNVITLQEVALLQLSAEGKAITEELNVVGMSYQENGRAEKTLSMQAILAETGIPRSCIFWMLKTVHHWHSRFVFFPDNCHFFKNLLTKFEHKWILLMQTGSS